MHEDASLLCRYARDRVDDAFAEVVRRHIDGVYSSALRRVGGDSHLAEDITQRVFVSLARQADQVSRYSAVSAWLYVATRNEAANAVRAERRRKHRELEAHMMEDRAQEPYQAADWSRLAPLLDSMIDQLSDADRTAVVMRYVEQASYADVGSALRVSEDAARMRVDRALDKLRALLEQRGIASTSAALGLALAQNAVASAPAGLSASVTTAALAAGPVSALSVAGLYAFMGTSKTVLSIVGIAAAVGLGSAGYQMTELRASEKTLAAAKSDNDNLAASVRSAVASADEAEARLDEARRELQKAQTADREPPPQSAPVVLRGNDLQQAVSEGNALLQRHPELQKRLTDYKRATVEAQFGAWVKRIGLSPETAELFYANIMGDGLLWQGELSNGTRMAIRLNRPSEASAGNAISELMGKFGGNREAFVREVRGEMIGREFASQMAAHLYLTAEPLTPEQADQLVAIVGASTGRGTPINGNISLDYEEAIRRAQGTLSPLQLEVLKTMQMQHQYRAALNQAMRTNAGSKNTSATPAGS